ncbi:BRO family protein [uncultured Kushneria sp.]|uniref:BRO-N domain-containing protein n=1 Tax=uncultured Kushneria sp. TaxID=905033 RepID=UPI003458BA83
MGTYWPGLTKAIIHSLEDDERAFIRDDSQKDPVQYVTQPGLFRIILADKSPACKKFQRWVLHDVLPSIQKYGTYPPPLKEDSNELKRAVELLLGEINERERLEQETNRRFIENEKKLQELDSKISEAGYTTSPRGYLSVESYCLKQTPPLLIKVLSKKYLVGALKYALRSSIVPIRMETGRFILKKY